MTNDELCNKAKEALVDAVERLNASMQDKKITFVDIPMADFTALSIMQIVVFATAQILSISLVSGVPREVLFATLVQNITDSLGINCTIKTEITEINKKEVH